MTARPTAPLSRGREASDTPGSAVNNGMPTSGLQTGMPSLGNAEGDFGAYTLLLSLRQLAKNLAAIPGRKTLFFSLRDSSSIRSAIRN